MRRLSLISVGVAAAVLVLSAGCSTAVTGAPEPIVEVSPLFFRRLSGRGSGTAFREDRSGRITQIAGDSWLVAERIK